jgi:hypothetical protein
MKVFISSVLAMLSSPTSSADFTLDQEIHQMHERLRALREDT